MIDRSTITITDKEVKRAVLDYLERNVFCKDWLENVDVKDLQSQHDGQWRIELVKESKLLGQ